MLQHPLLTGSGLAQQLQLAQLQQQPAQPVGSCSPAHTAGPAAELCHVRPAFAQARSDKPQKAVKNNKTLTGTLVLYPMTTGALASARHMLYGHLSMVR